MQQFQFPLPANFDSNNPEFDIFKNCPPEKYHNPQIKRLENVRIANNNVVFNYFNIERESCINEENYKKYSTGYKFFLKFIFPKFNPHKNKRFILITDEWTTNYYHWHLIALHRLLVLKENNLIENSILFLPIKYKKFPFVLPTLEKFGVKKEQIFYLRRKSNVKVKELFLVSAYQNHPESFRKIKNILTNNIESNFNLGDKIYISREKCPTRYIVNEKEFVDVISKYGFKKVLMEDYSYEKQISICHNAKYIIGPHGAGFTNILFMKDSGSVLELVGKVNSSRAITEYYTLACMTNIKYFYQQCEIGGAVADFHQGNLTVDLKKLEDNLQLMLKN